VRSHITLQQVDAIALYSASAEDRETVVCFLDFQEIKELSRKTQKPVTERLESKQPAQSESQNALSCRLETTGKNSP
jgi:hypothetical protein